MLPVQGYLAELQRANSWTKFFSNSVIKEQWWVPTRSQTNKSVCSEKQIQPMCGCHCYYLWSLSLNRLLARWARNGQSGLDCINYSSSSLYMAVPCLTTQYHICLLDHTGIPQNAMQYQITP